MKIYVLRHEQRGESPLPLSPLTSIGFQNSLRLIPKINDIKPDIIYCSPFVRTIETIYLYSIKYNKKINIENSLYEYVHDKEFNEMNYIHTIDALRNNKYNEMLLHSVNAEYESSYNVYDIKLYENEDDISRRVNKFIYSISRNKENQNKTILFVTHMSVINACKSYYIKTDLEEPFPMGHIELLYEKS